MLLNPTEMNIQLMQMLQKRSERRTLGHLGKGVHILGEALAAIAKLAIGTRDISMRVVDIARKEHTLLFYCEYQLICGPIEPTITLSLATSSTP